MLDQSFSAENFRNIFHIENRKGKLKKEMFSSEYIDLVMEIKALKNDLKEKVRERKEGKISKEEYSLFRDETNKKIKDCKKKKDEAIYKQVKEISTVINDRFKFTISNEERDEKIIYKLNNSLESFYAIKQLQYNIRKTFKAKQSNRYHILKQIKLLLNDNFPKYIIRTDIQSFFENIPQSKLLRKIEENTLLNYQSKKFIIEIIEEYEKQKDKNHSEIGKGIPRGIGISAYLAELYMRDIDSKIRLLEDVAFYARYVDDIFIIFIPNQKNSVINYYNQITEIVQNEGLTLKPENDEKTQLIDLRNKTIGFTQTINYLGYEFKVFSVSMKNEIEHRVDIFLSRRKIEKYKKRIDLSFDIYNEQSKFNEKNARKKLFDCLRMLTGNTILLNSKKGIKVGIYFSNSLLDQNNLKNLAELQGYLKRVIHTKLRPYEKLNVTGPRFEKLKKQLESKFSFCEGFKEKRFHKFKASELTELKKIWANEKE